MERSEAGATHLDEVGEELDETSESTTVNKIIINFFAKCEDGFFTK